MKRVIKFFLYIIIGIVILITLALLVAYIIWYKPIDPEELHSLINKSDRMVIKETPLQGAKILLETSSSDVIQSFNNSLVVKDQESLYFIACLGSPSIYFYMDGKEILQISNFGDSIKTSIWTSDATIEDVDKWITWFDKHGIPSVRKKVERDEAMRKQSISNSNKWKNKMPNSLVPLWNDSIDPWKPGAIEPLVHALKKEIPDRTQRILVLLEWFGSGAGPWSGFPSYEQAAEDMLLKYNTKDIVEAIESTDLTDSQIEGAARLFGGWTFSKQRPNDLKKVPPELKALFWDHVKSTQDEDKLFRARRAFQNESNKTVEPIKNPKMPF